MKFINTLAAMTVLLFCAVRTHAQFQTVYIGVNGLTCSQCSRTVEISIRKLAFVQDVDMNLEHTEGKITLKKNVKADMDQIAQAVINAGFSVRYLQADFMVNNNAPMTGTCLSYKGDAYEFTVLPRAPLAGMVKLTFLGKKFMPKKDYKKMGELADDKCVRSAEKVYHVSI